MKALILGAGYATRLYPLTLNIPKALLEVGGRTILGRILEKVFLIPECEAGYIVTNDKFYNKFSRCAKSENIQRLLRGKTLKVINDKTTSNKTRLGAIGDIDFAIDKFGIDDDLLVLGSDNLFGFDLGDFVKFAFNKKPAASLCLYDVRQLKKASLYGVVVLSKKSGEIVDFQEKPKKPKSTLAATAIYFYPREKLALLKEYMRGGLPKDAPGNLIKWLSKREKVYGYVFEEKWYDIGDEVSLKNADKEYRKKGKRGLDKAIYFTNFRKEGNDEKG